jgi:tRNA pseudouridine38-40 synthase
LERDEPEPCVRTVRLVVGYDGARFVGWQRQRAGRSVAAVLEGALETIAGRPVRVVGAGRTDAGVHALRQVAHARVESGLAPERLRAALNANLPEDVVVLEVGDAPADFHARKSARGKRYAYGLRVSSTRSPFWDRRVWRIGSSLDVDAMRAASRALVGRHDFSSFAGSLSRGRNPRRTLRRVRIARRGERIWIVLEGDGFLHRMARAIAGTLVEVGRGRRAASDVARVLEARDRRVGGVTAPAHGLYLVRALYDSRSTRSA